jgi:hypothetical protein
MREGAPPVSPTATALACQKCVITNQRGWLAARPPVGAISHASSAPGRRIVETLLCSAAVDATQHHGQKVIRSESG